MKESVLLSTTTSVPVGVMVAAVTSKVLGPSTTTSPSSSNALKSCIFTPCPSGHTNWMPLVNSPAAWSLVLKDVGAANTMTVPAWYAVACESYLRKRGV